MQLENKIYCHWDIVRFVTEDQLITGEGEFRTLSVSNGNETELMIFLGKEGSEYEVRVYKNEPTDKYIPNDSDNVKHYEENDEYVTFFFEEYDQAHSFVDNLAYIHPEYKKRPVRKIENVEKEVKDKHIYSFSRGEEGHITFDSNGYVIEAQGFNLLIWSSNLNIDKDLIGKHIDDVAEILKKSGKSRKEYLEFEANVHVEILKAMLKNSKK